MCFVVNSLCHSERLPRRSLAKAGSRLPRHSFMRKLGGISQHPLRLLVIPSEVEESLIVLSAEDLRDVLTPLDMTTVVTGD